MRNLAIADIPNAFSGTAPANLALATQVADTSKTWHDGTVAVGTFLAGLGGVLTLPADATIMAAGLVIVGSAVVVAVTIVDLIDDLTNDSVSSTDVNSESIDVTGDIPAIDSDGNPVVIMV